jgi:hypothetical protein
MLHKTIRRAIGSDSGAVQALLVGVEEQPAPNTDDRTGLVLVALAIAIFLFGVIQGDADDIRNMAGIALFPLFVGLALLGRFILAKRSGRS